MGNDEYVSWYDKHIREYCTVTKPPEWFVRELELIDPRLIARYNKRWERWEIHLAWTNRGKANVHILTVQEPGGDYRPLDQRTLDQLREHDAARVGSMKELMRIVNEKVDAHYAEIEQDNNAEIRDIWLDATDFVRNIPRMQVPKSYKQGWKQTASGLVVP